MFLGLALVLVAGSAQGALVAHYTFDTDTATSCMDVSGNNLHGDYYGDASTSATSNTAVPGNLCLYVDGNTSDGVTVPFRPGVDDILSTDGTGVSALQTTMSMAMWVRAFSPNNGWRAIAGKGDRGFTLRLNSRDGNQEMFGFKTSVDRPGGGVDWANSLGYGYQYLGTWHHIVGTFDGNTGMMQFYMNGALTHTNEIEAGALITANPAPFFIGGESTADPSNPFFNRRNWHGQIDDLRVYDHVLTQAEIDTIVADENQDPRDPTDFVRPARLYVSNAGDDLADGLTWGTAKATIQGAVDASYNVDDYSTGGAVIYSQTEIWVQSGTYTGDVMVLPYTDLIGGFAGTETTLAERIAIADNPTTITTPTLTAQLHKVEIDDVTSCSLDGFIFSEIPGFGVALNVGRSHGITISNCQFLNNDTDSGVQNGRCVLAHWGPDTDGPDADWVVFENCVWDNNFHDRGANGGTAGDPRGGCIFASRWINMRLTSCTFTNNQTYAWDGGEDDGRGGAVWYDISGDNRNRGTEFSLIVENSLFHNNRAGERGGAIYGDGNYGNLFVDNCVFTTNTVERRFGNNQGNSDGGAIRCDFEHQVWITNSLFEYNVSWDDGGAVFVGDNANHPLNNAYFDNCIFRNNRSDEGGAIRCESNNMQTTVTNCLFEDNIAEAPDGGNGDGGALCVTNNNHRAYIADCDFNRNLGKDQGGAIRGDGNDSFVTVLRCNFVQNSQDVFDEDGDDGGACRWDNNRVTFLMEDCLFDRNESTDWGGAIDFASDCDAARPANITIRRTQFLDNRSDSNGGALAFRNDWNNIDIEDCVFTDNTADANQGGAILIDTDFHQVNITNCDFTDNAADRGGAVETRGGNNNPAVTTFTFCTFLRNTAIRGNGRGGAINMANDYNDIVVLNCDFIENRSSDRGGAIGSETNWYEGGDIRDCNFLRNTNTGGSGGAIGISSQRSTWNVERCLFEDNFTNSDGGAIRFDNSTNDGNIPARTTISDCIFRRNTTTWGGGAIQQSGNYHQMSLTNCEFTDNVANTLGGALALRSNYHETTVDNCTFTRNSCNTSNNDGGAIMHWNNYSRLVLTNSVFTENSAGDSGGALRYSDDFINVTIDNCVFERNQANHGGAVQSGAFEGTWDHNDMVTNITNSQFLSNTANANYGGAIHFRQQRHTITVDGCLFYDNESPDQGGALRSGEFDEGRIAVTNSDFINNRTVNRGGAIQIWENNGAGYLITVDGCNFLNNRSNVDGGAIDLRERFIMAGPPIERSSISNSLFANNHAGNYGGALSFWESRLSAVDVSNTVFRNNTVSGGGAMEGAHVAMIRAGTNLPQNEQSIYSNCVFTGGVSGNMGGAAALWEDDPTFVNCTFSNNLAMETTGNPHGGTITCGGDADPVIANCIFDNEQNYAIWERGGGDDPIVITSMFNNCVPDILYDEHATGISDIPTLNALVEWTRCYTGDPMFMNTTASLYLLTTNSLAIDGGWDQPTTIGLVMPDVDMNYIPRPFDVVGVDNNPLLPGVNQDIGAYEWHEVLNDLVFPALVITPRWLDLGGQLVNQGATAPQLVSIVNTSNAAVNVSTMTLSSAAMAIQGGTAGFVLAPGETGELWITFDPVQPVAENSTLTIETDAPRFASTVITLLGLGLNTRPEAGIALTQLPPLELALDLDGDGDYVDTNYSCTQLGRASFTFEMWLNRADETEGWFVGDSTALGGSNCLHIGFRANSEAAFGFWGSDLGAPGAGAGMIDEWHHWAFTYDYDPNGDTDPADSAKHIYLDGVSIASNTGNIYNGTGVGNLAIGRRQTRDDIAFAGSIDNFRLWDRALTQDEVLTALAQNLTGAEAGMQIQMDFDNDVPTTATDDADGATTQSGANDGLLMGNATRVAAGPPGMVYLPTDPVIDLTEDETTSFSLLGRDADGDSLVGLIMQLPTLGTLYNYDLILGQGTPITAVGQLTDGMYLLYVPLDQSTSYTDVLEYAVHDGLEDSRPTGYLTASGLFTFNVTAFDDPAVITTNPINVLENTTRTLGSADISATGDQPISFEIATLPTSSTLLINGVAQAATGGVVTAAELAAGVLEIAPDPGSLIGVDAFDVTAIDSNGDRDTGTVDITYVPANTAPVLVNASVVTLTLTPVTLSANELLSTDDLDGPANITYTLTTFPAEGSLLVNGVPINAGNPSFVQADVDAGLVVFVGGPAAGDFSVTMDITDSIGGASGTNPGQTLSIVVSGKTSVKVPWNLME